MELLDKSTDVIVFQPGSATDSLVFGIGLDNSSVGSLTSLAVIPQNVTDNRDESIGECRQRSD